MKPDSTADRFRHDLAVSLKQLYQDTLRLERAYAALGGDPRDLQPTPPDADRAQTARGALQSMFDKEHTPTAVDRRIADAAAPLLIRGKRRVSEVADILERGGMKESPEAIAAALEADERFMRGGRGWWALTAAAKRAMTEDTPSE